MHIAVEHEQSHISECTIVLTFEFLQDKRFIIEYSEYSKNTTNEQLLKTHL